MQLERLAASVEAERTKNPSRYKSGANAKVLANIVELALRRIPQDPTSPRYRQGDALGKNYKHWFREKFSNGRFRLFFRYDLASKIIIYAWVNDSRTLRTLNGVAGTRSLSSGAHSRDPLALPTLRN